MPWFRYMYRCMIMFHEKYIVIQILSAFIKFSKFEFLLIGWVQIIVLKNLQVLIYT